MGKSSHVALWYWLRENGIWLGNSRGPFQSLLSNVSMTVYSSLLQSFCFEVPIVLVIPSKLSKSNLYFSLGIFLIFWKDCSFRAGEYQMTWVVGKIPAQHSSFWFLGWTGSYIDASFILGSKIAYYLHTTLWKSSWFWESDPSIETNKDSRTFD